MNREEEVTAEQQLSFSLVWTAKVGEETNERKEMADCC